MEKKLTENEKRVLKAISQLNSTIAFWKQFEKFQELGTPYQKRATNYYKKVIFKRLMRLVEKGYLQVVQVGHQGGINFILTEKAKEEIGE